MANPLRAPAGPAEGPPSARADRLSSKTLRRYSIATACLGNCDIRTCHRRMPLRSLTWACPIVFFNAARLPWMHQLDAPRITW
jgi:hypothetical protein